MLLHWGAKSRNGPQCRPRLPQPDSMLLENALGLAVHPWHCITITRSGHDSPSAAVRWQPLPCSSLPTICLAPKMCLAKTASHRQGAPRMRRPGGSLAVHSASPPAPPCSLALMCGRTDLECSTRACAVQAVGLSSVTYGAIMLSSAISLSRTGCHVRSVGRSATGRSQLWRMHAQTRRASLM